MDSSMIYTDFLSLIRQNTSNKLDDYKDLCRFCLSYQPDGIFISENVYNNENWQDAILNDYFIVTKQHLPITDEHPNRVCFECEANLHHCASFAQQIERNTENWSVFITNGGDVKRFDEFNESTSMIANNIDEIKIEYCDESYDQDCNGDRNKQDVLAIPPPVIETNTSAVDGISTKWEARTKTTPLYYMNLSTEFERTCKHCDAPTFSSLNRFYKHHKSIHRGKKNFSCDICGSKFITKTAIHYHMLERHADGKTHQCQFCAKLFYTDRELKGHEKVHLNVRSYVCKLCGKGFNTKTCLNVHMKSKAHNANYKTVKHKKNPQSSQKINKSFRCTLCSPSTAYKSLEERAIHRNLVHKPYDCDICKNSFITLESLNSHKLLHSGKPRPYTCSVCAATFNKSSHLLSHFKRRHTDEKSFQCSYCNKSFFENGELNAHVNLVHIKRNRVKCNECESHFASAKYLQKHILDKHSTEPSPYDCKVCGKKNGCAAILEQHRLKHHKEVNK